VRDSRPALRAVMRRLMSPHTETKGTIVATFDRFDICEAYLAVEMDWNSGGILHERGRDYSIGVQCHRLGFKAGARWNGWESLSENAREIYNAICERLRLGDGGYKPCACRDCFEIAIGYGRPMCSSCVEAGCDPTRECQCEPEPEAEDE
jgi:hypothetical protein